MKKKHILLASALIATPLASIAQQITDFEEATGSENYAALGVYDSWK